MKDFSFKINEDVLKNAKTNPMLEEDSMNEALGIAGEIIDVIEKHKISFYEAYVILASLADSIYLYSTFE